MLHCSIGIMAYNEEPNIAQLLLSLQTQKLNEADIREIIVVASGCTDKTADIAREFSSRDLRIKLLIQEKREGKSSAINYYLKNAKGDIIILESADTIPEEGALEKLVLPFKNSQIGMTGARPVPVNDPATFMGFAAHLLWRLHHEIALNEPKMGEMIAFRNLIKDIPTESAVDEASIESQITRLGYKIVYVPQAIVKNKGPENIRDFIRQRRRIHAGHLALKKTQGYPVSTMDGTRIIKVLAKNFSFNMKSVFFTPLVILLEVYGRMLGFYDFMTKKNSHTVWKMAVSTKDLSNTKNR